MNPTLFKTARCSRAIRLVTALVGTLALALGASGVVERHLPLAGLGVGLIVLLCYALQPVAYDLAGGCLTIRLRVGRLGYGPVVSAARVPGRWPFTLRLLGNGGVFGATGIFWNRRDGVFRAYLTSARVEDAVLVRTHRYTVALSPADPPALLAAVAAAAA